MGGEVKISLLQLFKPAPFLPERQDPQDIQDEYRYWRFRIFYSTYVGYAIFYFTRKSFTFATPHLAQDLGLSMADIGILGTILYVTYGISKFVNGVFSDRSNPRFVMGIGLILTGISNIFFGSSSSFILLALFWGLNGWFQGWGWPPCTKLLTYWFSQSERGKWWSLTSTSHNLGGAIVPLLVAYCCTLLNWRWGVFVPGLIAIVVGIWLLERLRDLPQSLGLPAVEIYKGEAASEVHRSNDGQILSSRDILFHHVLNNKAVWILSLCYFFVYVIRTALNDWAVLYLVQVKDYSLVLAASGVTWFEVGGFFGVLLSGWASDLFFRGRRIPIMLWSAFGLVLSVGIFWLLPDGGFLLDMALMGILGFLVFVPQNLVGLAAVEFVDKKAACTANGFAGCFAYVGAAATGYPLGKIIDLWSWEGFFITLLVCSLAVILALLPLTGRPLLKRQWTLAKDER